jgi:hypothetical protein
MVELGPIVRLQIQRSSLKTGEKPNRVYDPAPIMSVAAMWLSPAGALGRAPDGTWLVDVHHRAHPQTKNDDGEHAISVGFTGHYAAMRERFGARIELGCAGENVIAEAPSRVPLDRIARGLAIVAPDGTERLQFDVLKVAHPCRPFTGWALGRRVDPDLLKTSLQFLDEGTRGFRLQAKSAALVAVGDRLVIL